jgi:beta-phosphoglucomutase
MSPLRAILWDLDGVLADSADIHYLSWVEILKPFGVEFTRPFFEYTFGMNNRALINLLFSQPDEAFLVRLSEEKESAYRQLIPGQLQSTPGALEWLARFHLQGKQMAICSSGPPENIEATVDELKIRPYFGALVSAYQMPSKPDPAVFLEGARQLNMSPAECLVVEDAPVGIQGANSAGMRCLALATTHDIGKLTRADRVIKNLSYLTRMDMETLEGIPLSDR